MYKAALLFDKTNDWIRCYFEDFAPERADFVIDTFYDPDQINDYDVVFALSYTKILPRSFLDRNRLNVVVHASDLPDGRGFAPVQWQILEGKDEITVSLIEMAEEVDAGDILLQEKIRFDGTELYDEIRALQAQATLSLTSKFIKRYPEFQRRPQQGEGSIYRRRTAADGELNVDDTLRASFNLLRIANNEEWPSFFYMKGEKYILKIYKEKNGS